MRSGSVCAHDAHFECSSSAISTVHVTAASPFSCIHIVVHQIICLRSARPGVHYPRLRSVLVQHPVFVRLGASFTWSFCGGILHVPWVGQSHCSVCYVVSHVSCGCLTMRIASEQLRPAAPSLSFARIVSLHSGVQHYLLLIALQHPHPFCDGTLHLSALGQHSAFFQVRLGAALAFVSLLRGSGHHLPVLGEPHQHACSVASVFISIGDISGVCDL